MLSGRLLPAVLPWKRRRKPSKVGFGRHQCLHNWHVRNFISAWTHLESKRREQNAMGETARSQKEPKGLFITTLGVLLRAAKSMLRSAREAIAMIAKDNAQCLFLCLFLLYQFLFHPVLSFTGPGFFRNTAVLQMIRITIRISIFEIAVERRATNLASYTFIQPTSPSKMTVRRKRKRGHSSSKSGLHSSGVVGSDGSEQTILQRQTVPFQWDQHDEVRPFLLWLHGSCLWKTLATQ